MGRVVRDLDVEVAELAIVTFLLARAHGKPLVLLPAVVLGRFQHPFLVYARARGSMAPGDLAGCRVAIRSYSVTTVTWLRGILADDWGVDLDGVTWVTFEEPHVAEFRDSPSVQRAPEGKAPLIPDPTGAARAWHQKHQAIQVNHLVTVNAGLSRSRPRVVEEVSARLIPRRFKVDELFDDVTRRLGAI